MFGYDTQTFSLLFEHASLMVMMVAAVPVDATVGSSAEHTQADPDSHTVPNKI